MAFVVADRVRESSTTTGTGTMTLAGAVIGYQSFGSAIGAGNTTYYAISNPGVNEWEVGIGTVGSGTLARTTVLASSTGSAVDFTAGSKDVFVTYPSEGAVFADNSQTLTNKTISGSSNTLSNIGNSSLTNSKVIIGSTDVSLGATATSLSGLTSVTSTDFVGDLTGNADTATTATNLAGGAASQIPYQSSTGSTSFIANGTPGYVLKSTGSTPPEWADLGTLGVTTISFGSTGLTPATATGGAVSVAGTLALTNGGTGATTVAGAQNNLQVDPAGTAVAMAIALG